MTRAEAGSLTGRARTVARSGPTDRLEAFSRGATLLAYGLAVLTAFLAPLLAIRYSTLPFPGFYVDPTLVVNAAVPAAGDASLAGLVFPQRVVRVGGESVGSTSEYELVLARLGVGTETTIFTVEPNGAPRLYQGVPLDLLSGGELARRFWLPYLLGLAYLAIGIWVYRMQGATKPGRALAFFCACTSIVTLLLFDATTTHVFTALWTLAMSLEGGTLISLAMRFPEEWRPVGRRPWALLIPYLVSLGIFGVWVVTLASGNPWGYRMPWSAAYLYAAVGVVTFVGYTAYRMVRGRTLQVRQQSRIVLVGSAISFAPVTIWFLAPFVGRPVAFNPVVFLPSLVVFPIAVAIAIVRYRLWDVENIVNYTLVYGALTAVLAGLYTASIGLSQRLFVAVTGARSDAAIVITTLICASAFTTVRTRLQIVAQRRLGDPLEQLRPLHDYSSSVRMHVALSHPSGIAVGLLDQVATSLGAESGVLRLVDREKHETVHALPGWRGQSVVSIPLTHERQYLGVLQLGPRGDGRKYTGQEIDAVAGVVAEIAPYMRPETDWEFEEEDLL